MATTPFEIPKLPEAQTLTCDIYPRGIDTADQTGIVLTEETNRKGTYAGTVTAASSGLISVKVNKGGTLINEVTANILNTTDTFILEDDDRIIKRINEKCVIIPSQPGAGLPAAQSVSLDDLKRHLRITHHEEDLLLGIYINSATAVIESMTDRILIDTLIIDTRPVFPSPRSRGDHGFGFGFHHSSSFSLVHGAFDDPLELTFNPVSSITSVKYFDEDNVQQTLAAEDFTITDFNGDCATILTPNLDNGWPVTRSRIDAVEVTYVAGHAANGDSLKVVKPNASHAVLLLAGHYATIARDSVVLGKTTNSIPFTVSSLINTLKTGRVESDVSF